MENMMIVNKEGSCEKKILPFVMPLTNCYPATSEASAILFADDNIYEWMFNNFIQIFEVEGNHAVDYYDFAIDNNPFLSYNELDYSFVYNNWDNIIDFIVSAIREDYYVRLFVNMGKLSLYASDFDVQHDMIIYGYDKKESTFYVADHFQRGYFEVKTCTFEDFADAFDTYNPELFTENLAFLNSIQLIKKEPSLMRLRFSMYSPDEMEYFLSLNLSRITDSLSDYLNGVPTVNWYTRGRVMNDHLASSHRWGIKCYDILKLYVNELKNEHRISDFAIQSFYLFLNHKRVMIERIKVINNKYGLDNFHIHLDSFNELYSVSNRVMLKFIKLSMRLRSEKSCDDLIALIDKLRELDYRYTSSLLEDIKKIK